MSDVGRVSQVVVCIDYELTHALTSDWIFSHSGLMRMMAVATKTSNVSDIIGSIAWKVQSRGVSNFILLYMT